MNVIRSRQHNLSTEQVNKIALSANDDKRMIRSDKIQTFAMDMGQADNATGGLVKGAGWYMRGTYCRQART